MRVPSDRGGVVSRVRWTNPFLVVAAGLILALGAHRAAAADDYSNRIGLMLGGGAYKLVGGNLDHTKVGPWATTGLRFGWRSHWDVEASYRFGYNWDDTQNFRTRTTGLDLGLVFNGRPDAGWTWQAFGGSGVLWWNVVDFRAGKTSPGPFDSGPTASGFRDDRNFAFLNDNNFKFYGGLGLETHVVSSLTFRVGARIDYLLKQHTDNTGASDTLRIFPVQPDPPAPRLPAPPRRGGPSQVDANNWIPSVFGAFTWWFGDRDADGDGISNRLDKCPDVAEDKDGFQDEDGCPDLDNDNDGVPDVKDKCPDVVEDKDGFQDEDGCPDLDNDNDGIPDAQDKCADVAEDKDGFQDEDGCPDLDNDGDSIPDPADQCPDTPAGTHVDSTGCPLAKTVREQQLLDTGMIRLSGVKFDTNKADIKPEFAATLDSVVAILGNWPVLRIEIGGHSDSKGSDVKNQELSQRRAQAVLYYLQSKNANLDVTKYTVQGYGETVPIADNTTDAGRAENRRVEFKVLNRDELQAEMQRRMGAGVQETMPPPEPEKTPGPEPKKE